METRSTGKGWVVVCALFLMLGIVITARNSIGLLMPYLEKDLGWSYGRVSLASATMLTTMALIAPIAGMMLDRHGPRLIYALGMSLAALGVGLTALASELWQLVVFYGIVGGLGFAAISPSLVSTTVASYFDRGLGLATGVATSGSTAGTARADAAARDPDRVVRLAVEPVDRRRGRGGHGGRGQSPDRTPRGAARMTRARTGAGAVARASAPSAMRTRPAKARSGCSPAGFAICGFTTAGVIKIHLIPYAVACGFPPLESATAYGVMSAFSLAGMIAFGHLSDRFHRPALLASIYFMRALTFLVLLQIPGNSTLLFAFAVLFGVFDYATFPIVASLVASHMGRHIMGFTMGLIFAAHSLGAAAGAFLGGHLFDLFARYDWVWYVSFALALMAAALTILIRENRGGSAVPAPAGA